MQPLIAGVLAGILAASATAQDLTALFSDDATEDTTGVFLEVNRALEPDPELDATAGLFHSQFLMRPFSLDASGLTQGFIRLSATTVYGEDGMLEVYDPATGDEIPLPAIFDVAAVPSTVFVSATSTGQSILRLDPVGQLPPPGTFDEVLVRVGPFPGLAGNALSQYPFFEYPKAINVNAQVETALDPTRHGERLGLDYDVYIVRHRTFTQWAQDNTLVDLSGAIETATVLAPDIQSNVVAAWPTGLDGSFGVNFGSPYDVVYDFGQDGFLDPGDLLDGLNAGEAGFYVVRSPSQTGPHNVSSFTFDDPGLFFAEGFDGGGSRTMRSRGLVLYPDPLPPGKLPLVTFSHGNTGVQDSYRGYRYLQRVLASYGFITASFDMFPAHVSLGIRWRGWLSNLNTERLILQTNKLDRSGIPYPPSRGGVIDDKVDPDRIITSGHSRGGEGVIIQYQQLAHPGISGIRPPNGVLEGFDADSFLGIHTIAQVTFLTAAQGSRTDDVPYLLYFGSSDNDVCGCSASVLPTIHYNRSTGDKAMSYLYGAGHGFYNQKWSCVCTGPFTMTRDEVEAASLGYLVPWVMMVERGNVAGQDFFTRGPTSFRPINTEFIPEHKRMVNLYRDAAATGNFVMDDYETEPSENVSSSGQPVTFTVNNLFEGFFLDTDPSGGWHSNEPDGGFWWETHGCIFQFNGGSFEYSQSVAPEERDLSDDRYLSFIICQQPGHRRSDRNPGPRSVSVQLVDGGGVTSEINTLPYGVIDEPYTRNGGWGAAFTTFRLRLADFEANGSGIDLKNIVVLALRCGRDWGSEEGRLGLDDLEIIH